MAELLSRSIPPVLSALRVATEVSPAVQRIAAEVAALHGDGRCAQAAEQATNVLLQRCREACAAALGGRYVALYTRRWRTCGDRTSSASPTVTVRAMQFNLLAEGLSGNPMATPPFPNGGSAGAPLAASSFGDFDAVQNPRLVFDFPQFRGYRLLEEMLRHGAVPDVLCVQECDHFFDFFCPLLQSIGYRGVYTPKGSSPCLHFGYHSDGVALFYRTSVFRLHSTAASDSAAADAQGPISLHNAPAGVHLRNDGCVYIALTLRHIATGRLLVVATTHLKAKAGQPMEVKRREQMRRLLDEVRSCCVEAASSSTSPSASSPSVLLMGDFNAEAAVDSRGTEPLAVPLVLQWAAGSLASALPLRGDGEAEGAMATDEEPFYTTWKVRGPTETKRVIDYVFASCAPRTGSTVGASPVTQTQTQTQTPATSPMRVCGYLQPPEAAETATSSSHMPDERYPSDHVAQLVELAFS